MPLDNSCTQSFRTNRIKCKAIAGTPGPLSNEQTVPESTFVDFKLGRMPYLVQPNGGPVTTDAGCCGDGSGGGGIVTPVDCNVCREMGGILATVNVYNDLRSTLTSGTLPVPPSGYNGLVIIFSGPSGNQDYIIDSLIIPQDGGGNITISPTGYTTYRKCSFSQNPTFKQDFIIIFDENISYPSLQLSADITINGTIQTCDVAIISNTTAP